MNAPQFVVRSFIHALSPTISTYTFLSINPMLKDKERSFQMAKQGLYANIHAKRKRIAAGSGEKMRSPGDKGAPTAEAFKQSEKTAKKPKRKSMMGS